MEIGANSFNITINPLLGIPVAAVATFIVGAFFERFLLRPMHLGKVERIHEYAILITFGFGFFLESLVLSTQGPLPSRSAVIWISAVLSWSSPPIGTASSVRFVSWATALLPP